MRIPSEKPYTEDESPRAGSTQAREAKEREQMSVLPLPGSRAGVGRESSKRKKLVKRRSTSKRRDQAAKARMKNAIAGRNESLYPPSDDTDHESEDQQSSPGKSTFGGTRMRIQRRQAGIHSSHTPRSSSLPNFTHNDLSHQNLQITDIDEVVNSNLEETLFVSSCSGNSTGPADIDEAQKQALVEELKSIFKEKGLRKLVDKRSQDHRETQHISFHRYSTLPATVVDMEDRGHVDALDIEGIDEWRDKVPEEWTSQNVRDWLEAVNLPLPAAILFEKGMEGRELVGYYSRDFDNIGIKDPYTRQRLLDEVTKLTSSKEISQQMYHPNLLNPLKKPTKINNLIEENLKIKEKSKVQRTLSQLTEKKQNILKDNPIHGPPSFNRRPGHYLVKKTSNISDTKHLKSNPKANVQRKTSNLSEINRPIPSLQLNLAQTSVTNEWEVVQESGDDFGLKAHPNKTELIHEKDQHVTDQQTMRPEHPQHANVRSLSVKEAIQEFDQSKVSIEEWKQKPNKSPSAKKPDEDTSTATNQTSKIRKSNPDKEIIKRNKQKLEIILMKKEIEDSQQSLGIKQKHVTIYAELPTTPDEMHWLSYKVNESTTASDLVQLHLSNCGLSSCETPFRVLETRQIFPASFESSAPINVRRAVSSFESVSRLEASWHAPMRFFLEIVREDALPTLLGDELNELGTEFCSNCQNLEKALEILYNQSEISSEVYLEAHETLQNSRSAIWTCTNKSLHLYEMELGLKEQLHQIVKVLEDLKKRQKSHQPGKVQTDKDNSKSRAIYQELAFKISMRSVERSIGFLQAEEQHLLNWLKRISGGSHEAPETTLEVRNIEASLYSALSVSGQAIIYSLELMPRRLKPSNGVSEEGKDATVRRSYNFQLADTHGGGVVVSKQDAESLLMEGDRLLEVNGHGVVGKRVSQVKAALEGSLSARLVLMRLEQREKVISSSLESNTLRQDVRLLITEIQREKQKCEKLSNDNRKLMKTANEMEGEKARLREELETLQREKEEANQRLESMGQLLDGLALANQITSRTIEEVTQEKEVKEEALSHLEKESEDLRLRWRRSEEALRTLEDEMEFMIRNQSKVSPQK